MMAVIDSDVLIDYLQGVEAAKVEIGRYRSPLYSVISWMEIMVGAASAEEAEAAAVLFGSMRRIDLSHVVAQQAVEVRKKLTLRLPDAVILASADVEGCLLVTRNTRDFDRDDPRIRIPYSV
jgi:predicted nucleic acid-binding protein